MSNVIVALENIRSLHNVGAIIRTCEFFGIFDIALIGYTGFDPIEPDQIHAKLKKTALSSLDKVKISRYKHSKELLDLYSSFELVCVENNVTDTIPLNNWQTKGDLIILFGNEVTGVEKSTLKSANIIIEIPRIGQHPSLNVATTAGIVLYKITTDLQGCTNLEYN